MSSSKRTPENLDQQERFHNKTAFALAGINSGRHPFAESGLANINHHLQSNAFAAQALSERGRIISDKHPALRPRGLSDAPVSERRDAEPRRIMTPHLRDAIELLEEQKRGEALARRDQLVADFENSGRPFANKPPTPAKKSFKDVFTPVSDWLLRRGGKKDRIAQADAQHDRQQVKSVATSTSKSSSIAPVPDAFIPMPPPDPGRRGSIPPTPPAKNTPPVANQAEAAQTEETVHVAFPTLRKARSNEELKYRVDRETGGLLPIFNGSPIRAYTAGSPDSPNSSLLSTPTKSRHWLAPDVYAPERSSSIPRLNVHSAPPFTPPHNDHRDRNRQSPSPVLRHVTGSVSRARTVAGDRSVRSQQAEFPSPATPINAAPNFTDYEHAALVPAQLHVEGDLRGNMLTQLRQATASRALTNQVKMRVKELHIQHGSPVSEAVRLIEERISSIQRAVDTVETHLHGQLRYVDEEIERHVQDLEEAIQQGDVETEQRLAQSLSGAIEKHIQDMMAEQNEREKSVVGIFEDMTDVDPTNSIQDNANTIKEGSEVVRDLTAADVDLMIQQKLDAVLMDKEAHLQTARELAKVSAALEINNREQTLLNARLTAADEAAEEGYAKAEAFSAKLNSYLKEMTNLKKAQQHRDTEAASERKAVDGLYAQNDILKTRIKAMGTELDIVKQCHKSIDQMYVRVSAMDQMWTSMTTGETILPWRMASQANHASTPKSNKTGTETRSSSVSGSVAPSTSTKKKSKTKSANGGNLSDTIPQASSSSNSERHPSHGTTIPYNMPAQHLSADFPPQADGQMPGLVRPQFKRWKNSDLPLNYEAFFGLLVSIQERLHQVEQSAKEIMKMRPASQSTNETTAAATSQEPVTTDKISPAAQLDESVKSEG